jgi:hypothetical protein
MLEFTLSKKPLQKNPNCSYCGRIFNDKGLTLQIQSGQNVIHFPICQPCFQMIPLFQATVNLETGYARVKR